MRLMVLAAGGLMLFIAVSYVLHEKAVSIEVPSNSLGADAVSDAAVKQTSPASAPSPKTPPSASPNSQSSPSQASGPTAIASTLPVPEAAQTIPWTGPEELVLWQNAAHPQVEQKDGIEQIIVQINPQDLVSLHPGQTLVMPLPDGASQVRALITQTFNDALGTYNWKAQVQNDLPNASVFIVQGSQQTHIAIFTEAGSYTLIADNKTGRATLVDEGKLIARQAQFDDGVVVQEHATFIPPLMP
jgi:hypothetical protein